MEVLTEFSAEVKRTPGGDGRVQFGIAFAQDLQRGLPLFVAVGPSDVKNSASPDTLSY
ncbi:MAG: hypothetical protein ABSH21_06830 [Verrucomicrobiia bacterium]|jgi:hypothetical protein